MTMVNVHEAKTQLSRLLERVRAGEEIVIAKAGRPCARLMPLEPPPERVLGRYRDRDGRRAGLGVGTVDRGRAGRVGRRRMNLLLDTCTLLWAWGQPEKLSRRLQGLLRDPAQPGLGKPPRVPGSWRPGIASASSRTVDTSSPSGTNASHGMDFARWPSPSATRCEPARYPARIAIRSTA